MSLTPKIVGFAGVLVFALALWRATMTPGAAETPQALARIEPVFGTVTIEHEGAEKTIKKPHSLQKLETAQTGPESEALLDFPSGEQVRMLENSMILADFEGGRPVLIVKAGDLWVERTTTSLEGPLISREGLRRTLAEDLKLRLKKAGKDPTEIIPEGAKTALTGTTRAPTPKKPPSKGETLSAEYIEDVMRGQRHSFFKCYGQLLQHSPGMVGEASIAFTIEHTGKVAAAQIPNSTVQDLQFRRCLTDAVKRIEFKSFAGDSVQTLFPIRFE